MDSNQSDNDAVQNQPSRMKRIAESVVDTYRRLRNRLLAYFVPNEEDDDSTHVTTSNLEHHRKQILEQARRHVKPLTATNSHVVRNSIIVGAVALVVVLAGLYLSVFRWQPTNNFYYQLSQLLPMPVGEISATNINYDRVLFYYRAESRSDNFDLDNAAPVDDDATKAERLQRSFLKAREAVYIESLAEIQGAVVTDEEVESIISDLPLLEAGTTDLDVVLKEFRGWTRDDLFRETRLEALKSSKLIPAQVQQLTEAATARQFESVATELKDNGAEVGVVSDVKEPPAVLTQAAAQLEPGAVTVQPIQTETGMYVLLGQEGSAQYVLINSGLRKQLLEAQAATAASISCLSGVQFGELDIAIAAEAGYFKCLF